ncbi:MAG TPA: hypothetical protein VL752_01870 [Acidisoma sp.]|uniref:hypothetical protein n=1 Tax=Acidisoma sp. TaxID=1872115 RepID=UPI002C543363|nr:hypothetical protein [Acidisoma sp.]HTH99666.1 hypothetical protein [Acidisoma sp.]
MFLPQLTPALIRLAVALGLLGASTTVALAQTAPQRLVLHATRTYQAQGAASAGSDAMLASLSAEAGVPFFTAAEAAKRRAPIGDQTQTPLDPALCLRAGVGISAAVMTGSQVNVQHGIIGCHTETAGLPISVSPDPALQPPPTSRTGEYTVDLSLRYRLLQRKRLQVEASLTEQGLAYSIDSPISGNNLVAAMSVQF